MAWKGFLSNKLKGVFGPGNPVVAGDVFVLDTPVPDETDPTVGQHIKDITTTDISNWVTAFNNNIVSGSVTGDTNKVITLTRRDSSTLTIPFTDLEGAASDDVINTLSWDSATGVLTAVTSQGVQITTNLDNRYSLIGHTHDFDKYQHWLLKADSEATPAQIGSLDQVNFIGDGSISVVRETDAEGTVIRITGAAVAVNEGTVIITSDTTLSAALHNNKTLICRNDVTDIILTIPTGLGTDFTCNIISEDQNTRYTEIVAGTGVTLKAPHGAKLLADYVANLIKRTGEEVFNLQGELTP